MSRVLIYGKEWLEGGFEGRVYVESIVSIKILGDMSLICLKIVKLVWLDIVSKGKVVRYEVLEIGR